MGYRQGPPTTHRQYTLAPICACAHRRRNMPTPVNPTRAYARLLTSCGIVLAVACGDSAPSPSPTAPTRPLPATTNATAEPAPGATAATTASPPAAANGPAPSAGSPPAPACKVFRDRTSLDLWASRMREALQAGRRPEAQDLARCLAADLELSLQRNPASQGVDVFEGQLDRDPAPEWVVQIRQRGRDEGINERTDSVWVTVLDQGADGYRAVGSIARPAVSVCQPYGRLGLVLRFKSREPGPRAALEVTEQDIHACGSMVDVVDKVTLLQIDRGKLSPRTPRPRTSAAAPIAQAPSAHDNKGAGPWARRTRLCPNFGKAPKPGSDDGCFDWFGTSDADLECLFRAFQDCLAANDKACVADLTGGSLTVNTGPRRSQHYAPREVLIAKLDQALRPATRRRLLQAEPFAFCREGGAMWGSGGAWSTSGEWIDVVNAPKGARRAHAE